MRNTGLEEAQAGIKIARRNISNIRYADDTTLMTESEEELRSLLMKEESENVCLKLNIHETSHPRLLPQSPKVCSIHLCLFFYFAYRVIITIFLNSIYMR